MVRPAWHRHSPSWGSRMGLPQLPLVSSALHTGMNSSTQGTTFLPSREGGADSRVKGTVSLKRAQGREEKIMELSQVNNKKKKVKINRAK